MNSVAAKMAIIAALVIAFYAVLLLMMVSVVPLWFGAFMPLIILYLFYVMFGIPDTFWSR